MDKEQIVDIGSKSAPYFMGVIGLAFLSTTAFRWPVRREIIKRADGTCEDCETRSFSNGDYMIAGHLDHRFQNYRDKKYNDPNNGVLRCLPCEYTFHLNHFLDGTDDQIGMTPEGSLWSLCKLEEEMEIRYPRLLEP